MHSSSVVLKLAGSPVPAEVCTGSVSTQGGRRRGQEPEGHQGRFPAVFESD